MGKGDKSDRQFGQMIEAAMRWNKPVRIGVNWGSLDQELLAQLMDENAQRAEPWDAKQVMYEALITSAIESAKLAESMGMDGDQIILSCKVSGVQDLISVYRELARRCDYPLHLGLTEAGMGTKGTVASATALAHPAAGRHRRHHPRLAHAAAGRVAHAGGGDRLRDPAGAGPAQCSCPASRPARAAAAPPAPPSRNWPSRSTTTCARRCRSGAASTPASRSMKVAVMGCIVNGPGESKHADIGISLPGTGEAPAAPVFIDGEKALTLRGDNIANEFHQIVENYIEKRFGQAAATA